MIAILRLEIIFQFNLLSADIFGTLDTCSLTAGNFYVAEYRFTLPNELRWLINDNTVAQTISGSLPVEADANGCLREDFLTVPGNFAKSGQFDTSYEYYGNYSDYMDSFFSFDLNSYGFYEEETFPESEELSDRNH